MTSWNELMKCLIFGHDRYVVPLWRMGVCKRCGNGS